MGTAVRRVLGLRTSRSPWSSPGPSLAGLATSEPGSRDRPEDHSSNRSGGSHLPLRARRNVRPGAPAHKGLSTNLREDGHELIPELAGRCGRCVDTLAGEVSRDGSSARSAHGRPGRLGAPVRGLQPSLAERALPADPADQGPAERHAGWATRSMRRSTDIPIGTCSCSRSSSTSLGQRAAADIALVGDDPVHAGRRRRPARRTTPTPTARPGSGRRSTRR